MSTHPATTPVPTLAQLAAASSATAEFKAALDDLAAGRHNPRIQFNAGSPPVKVQRLLCKLLETHPGEAIESVEVEGRSGCSDYRGTLHVRGARRFTVEFVWDCAWKASQVGYKTFWGDPDQQKAAREFGYQCFERFDEVG
jgi:hypothetical protein